MTTLAAAGHLLAAAIVAALPSCASAATPHEPSTIGEGEAMRLASQAYRWPEKNIWYDRRERSFFVLAPLGGEVGAPVTWLGVNPWTGDVWDIWECKRLSTARLRRSQAAIRRRFPPGEMQRYARLHALRPTCYGP
ncbi:MAG: hypothetical protein ACREDY_02715 [Bradyrhizobium sp.]